MLSWMLAAALSMPGVAPPVATAAPPPETPTVSIPATLDPIPQDEVMALPAELREKLHAQVLEGAPSPTLRFQRLTNFIIAPDGLGMTYEEDATYTVTQAYATRQANCLTFTLLVLALAREAGLDAYPQEMGETLSWREVDGTIYRDNHINAGVSVGTHRYTIDPAADLVLLSQPPVVVSHDRLLAHYYNNVAVDRLQEGQLPAALRDMEKALSLDPQYATLWSNVGVMRLHSGDGNGAEHAYSRALELNPHDASALFNMVQLLDRRGDPREGYFRQRLSRVEQKDPLQQFMLALDFERAGDYPHALERLQRAIQLKPDEHRFYAALARVYASAGDTRRSGNALARAQSLSKEQTRRAYNNERGHTSSYQANR
jgi:Flp pilus assembly protein TadD